MNFIKYLEKKVEKKAQRMIKHKRLYAWISFIGILTNIFRGLNIIFKYRTKICARNNSFKNREYKDSKCPYKINGGDGVYKNWRSEDRDTESKMDISQA